MVSTLSLALGASEVAVIVITVSIGHHCIFQERPRHVWEASWSSLTRCTSIGCPSEGFASRGCPSILSRRHPWQHEKASASLQASCSWRSLMPVAAGVSQGNCTLILSAAVCHSDNMSAESVERIDWDDDMSSWSSAFDPLPPPPESPKRKQKTRKKKTKKKKKKKQEKDRAKKARKKRQRTSSDELASQHGAEQMPQASSSRDQAPELEAAAPSTPPEDQGRWIFQAVWEPSNSSYPQVPRPGQRTGKAAAKMLVRAGLRCRCYYALRCPDLFRDERGTEHYRSCLQPS